MGFFIKFENEYVVWIQYKIHLIIKFFSEETKKIEEE